VKPGPVKESIMVPWRLDSEGRPPDIGVVAEVEAAIGTILGAATPAEGYRRLVRNQEAGSLIAGGSRTGTTGLGCITKCTNKRRLQTRAGRSRVTGGGREGRGCC
jgi:hypothetical protein